jgi:hypothetical protein
MRTKEVLMASLVWSVAWAAENTAFRVSYAGGTVPGLEARSDARLDLTKAESLTFVSKQTSIQVPYRKINTIEYGQTVSRRYAEAILISPFLLLAKSRKHFVTVGYVDKDDRQQALVVRVGKGEIRSLLASLEARSGRRVEYTDDEARKSGR